MNNRNVAFIVLGIWTLLPLGLFGDVLTFEIAGIVKEEASDGFFRVDRPYVMTVTIDAAVPNTSTTPDVGYYPNAVRAYLFDYNSGAYTAQGHDEGGITVGNEVGGRLDFIMIYGFTGFPPINGRSHSIFAFTMEEEFNDVVLSTSVPRSVVAREFRSRDFQISWGVDFETRSVHLTIDSFSLVRRRPEITGWTADSMGLILTIEFPNQLHTNVLEKSLDVGNCVNWEPVADFISAGGSTNWAVPIVKNHPASFYRLRP